MKRTSVILLLILGVCRLSQSEELTLEEYTAQLNALRARDAEAVLKIAQLKSDIGFLRMQVREKKELRKKKWDKILNTVDATQEEYDGFTSRVMALQHYAQTLKGWTPELQDSMAVELARLKSSSLALIPRVEGLIFNLEHALVTAGAELILDNDIDIEKTTEEKAVESLKLDKIAEPEKAAIASKDRFGESDEVFERSSFKPEVAAMVSNKKVAEKKLESADAQPKEQGVMATRSKPYKVRPGDTLSKIAEKMDFGWEELYQLNASVIHNPHHIYPGQILRVPN